MCTSDQALVALGCVKKTPDVLVEFIGCASFAAGPLDRAWPAGPVELPRAWRCLGR